METLKTIAFVLLFFVFIFLVAVFGFGMDSFFKPAYRKLEYRTFKESEQFRDGMTRQLEELQLQYVQAKNDDEKAIIRNAFLHQASEINKDHLSPDLRSFYYSIK